MKRIFAFLAVLAIAGIAFADIAPSGFAVSPSTLKPGVAGSLSFTLANTGTYTITGVDLYASGNRMTFFSEKINVGTIGAGATTTVTVPFKVDSDAAAGVYNIQLTTYWVDPVGGTSYKTFSVPVTVSSAVNFDISGISYNETQIRAGHAFTASATITNTGGAAKNARLSSASESFRLLGSSQITLGNLDAGSNTQVSIPLSADSRLTPGIYNIPVTITYEDELGVSQSVPLSIGSVDVYKSPVFFNVVAVPGASNVLPGQRITVNVNITNVGGEAAKSVRIAFASDSPNFVQMDSSERYVEEILPGETEVVGFEMGVNTGTLPGFYPLHVTISYLDARGEEQQAVRQGTGIEVAGVSDMTAFATASPAPVTAGKKYTLSVQVSNIGTTQLKSVRASVSGAFFDLLASPENYIGTLNVDDYSTISYPVYIREGIEPGRQDFTVRLTYRDQNNVERSVEKMAYIDIVSAETAAKATATGNGMNGTLMFVGGLFVLVVLYFAYRRFTRKRRQ